MEADDGSQQHIEHTIYQATRHLHTPLAVGELEGLEALKQARNLYREYKADWARDELVSKVISRSDSREFAISPDKVFERLMGKARIGSSGLAATDLRKIRDSIGADSEAWLSLREEALVQMLQAPSDARGDFANFGSRFNRVNKDAEAVLKELFGNEYLRVRELAAIMGLVGSDQHEWLYQSQMTPDEIAFFNIYDNQGLQSGAHSALDMVGDPSVTTIRKSIESRTLVGY